MADEKLPIDLSKLSERELLIIVAIDVRQLKLDVEAIKEREAERDIQIEKLKTEFDSKSKVWGGIIGFATAIIVLVIDKLIK